MWLALAVSALSATVTMAGVLAVRQHESWARSHKIWFVSFAAGVLIAVPLLHLIPESVAMGESASFALLAGFLLMHLLDRYITVRVCERPDDAGRALGLVPLIGIGFHSMLDGIVYSIGFSFSAFTGLLMALGMVLHEFPEGLVTYTLLLFSSYPPRRALLLTFLAASVSTPLGTLLSYPFVSRLNQETLGGLLALSAGALLYVGASHLLPQAAAERGTTWLGFLVGIAVSIAAVAAA